MPSIPVHLTVAGIAADTLGVADMPSFLLGNIAPDAVNADSFAPKEVRYGAHIRSHDRTQWKKNISEFRDRKQSDYADCPDFFKGVLMHLYTDIAWDEAVQPKLFRYLREKGVPEEDMTRQKWQELDKLDSLLADSPGYRRLTALLAKAEARAVTTVTAQQLSRWQDIIVSEEYPEPSDCFLGMNDVMLTLSHALSLYNQYR